MNSNERRVVMAPPEPKNRTGKPAAPATGGDSCAEAVADERRRIDAEIRQSFPPSPRYMPRDTYNGMRDAFRVALDIVAAGSVPVATPEPDELPIDWYHRHGTDDDGRRFSYCECRGPARAHCVLPIDHGNPNHQWAWFTKEDRETGERALAVATPPAEPADDEDETPTGKVTRSEAEALRTKAAPIDLLASLQANLPPAPSQPVTCEHGKTGAHEVLEDGLLGWCPGPVSVPKESSE